MLSAEQRKQIADAYAAGEKVDAISAEFEIDDATPSKIAKSFGIELRRPENKALKPQQEFFLCADYVSSDLTLNEIAEKYSVHHCTVLSVLKRNQIELYGSDNKKRSRN